MSAWESLGKSDEWYTPKYIFDAIGETFDVDVASPKNRKFCCVSANKYIEENSLQINWDGFVWMNPPFGGRNAIMPWMEKFFIHQNGIALSPDRTSAPWYQYSLKKSDGILLIDGKVKFIDEYGNEGKSPSTGTTLWASGERAVKALINAQKNGLGRFYRSILDGRDNY